MNSISAYDTDGLIEYFAENVKRPLFSKGVPAIDQGLRAMEAQPINIPVNIGAVREFYRGVTEGRKLKVAMWRWLRPNYPRITLNDFESLQKTTGLDHLHQQTFAERLIGRCKEVIQDHPKLQYWAESRIALLDYVRRPPRPPDAELLDIALSLRLSLNEAHYLFWQDADRAAAIADKTLTTAMEAAARALADGVREEGSAMSSNLMVPMKWGWFDPTPSSIPHQNDERARALWQMPETERRLVIVAETRGANHVGFWVPLANGDGGKWLPGAPEAWGQRQGSSVFKDDLPPLSGFSQALNVRWRSFMMDRFRERLFVSLPFIVSDGTGGRLVPCVINVNVDVADVSGWRKVMHSEWLTVGRERVQPFVEIAFMALRLILSQVSTETILDTGSEDWNRLPLPVPSLPEKGTQ